MYFCVSNRYVYCALFSLLSSQDAEIFDGYNPWKEGINLLRFYK